MKLGTFRVRAVDVPLRLPLATGGGVVKSAPLALLDIHTDEGVTGSSYVFCYTPFALAPVVRLIESLGQLLKGDEAAPFEIEAKLQRSFRLVGPQGLMTFALAAIDMAVWDIYAKRAGQPLTVLLGGKCKPIPTYQSRGLGIIGPEKAGAETSQLIEDYRAIKIRLGYPDASIDLEVVREVRKAAGPDKLLMTDYNQSLTAPEASRRAQLLEAEDIYWIEEPVRADDYEGHAQVRSGTSIPVQIGENWWGPNDMQKSLDAGASDFGMEDAMKIGGVTGWLRASALAQTRGIPLSSHLFPEISAHLLAVTPTAHWLEYVDFASSILKNPVRPSNGFVTAPATPGTGIEWEEESVAQWLCT